MWFTFAVAAAILWGISYAVSERLFRSISIPTLLFLSSAASTVVMFIVAVVSKRLALDMRTLVASRGLLVLLAVSLVTYILANTAISYAIFERNATVAAIVEIAYPFFTALAAFFIFGEKQFSSQTFIGGAFIFIGAALVSISGK